MYKKPIQLTLPNPCTESRKKMKTTTAGYFCAACHTEVVDYREYSDAALAESLNRRKAGKACGIFREDQLNRSIYPLRQSCSGLTHTWKALGLLAGLSLAPQANNLTAQSNLPLPEVESAQPVRPDAPVSLTQQSRYLSGQIINWEDEEPVKNARVRFEECGKMVRTDKNGRFKLVLPDDYKATHITVTVSTRRTFRPFSKKIPVAALPAEGLTVELRNKKERVVMGSPRVWL